MEKDELWRRFIGGSYGTAETIGDYKVEYDSLLPGNKTDSFDSL